MDNVSAPGGLTPEQVIAARQEYGPNVLPEPKKPSLLVLLLRQFTGFLVVILIIAAVIAFALGEVVDALAITLVVILNGVLGFVQDWRAETALESLREMLSPQALVIRDGAEVIIPAEEIVPQDLIILNAGDRIPADGKLLARADIEVDESVLTGESMPVSRGPGDLVHAGTSVVLGRAEAIVMQTGTRTEFGQIATLTGDVGTRQTHLQVLLGRLAKRLGLAALTIAAGVLGLGLLMGRAPIEMFMTGLSLAVAIVPEGLPAVVTITLALGAAAMVRQKALARRLQAVETLGAASVICSDKTGTMTENKMTATRIWTPGADYDVTGVGYDPAGHIERDGHRIRAADDPTLERLLNIGQICTHASLRRDGSEWVTTGAPTEAALVTLALKGWSPAPERNAVVAEVPFSSDRKRMSVLARKAGRFMQYTKGAPEQILEICTSTDEGPLTEGEQVRIKSAYEAMAADGLRVIALAYREQERDVIEEQDMVFAGLVGLIDPPRDEVRNAIRQARSAGIRIIMITGDSPITARAIADSLDLPNRLVLTGPELDGLSDDVLDEALRGDVLFARTKPAHKMRIVASLQAQDQIVAMTGDGVNDAPALKQADIGVAMGIRGTDVARDASDLVLLDDNFATIVRAIGEGRRQFSNLRKFVRYLLSSNAGEVVALTVNIMIGGPLIFLPTQILWMNLVTDGVTAVALGLERAEPDEMKHKPRPKSASILNARGFLTIATLGIYTGAASLWIFLSLQHVSVELARTTAFTAMVIFEKMSVFAFRSLHLPCWKIGWFSNPLLLVALVAMLGAQALAVYWTPLRTLLRTVPLGWSELQMIFWFTIPLIIVPELVKTVLHLRRSKVAA